MNKILIATDGSPSADEAVEFGVELGVEHAAELIVVHVAPAVDVVPALGVLPVNSALPHELTAADRSPLQEAPEAIALGRLGHG